MVKLKFDLCFLQPYILFVVTVTNFFAGAFGELHRTQAAAEKTRDQYCYRCDTLQEQWSDRCLSLTYNSSTGNNTGLLIKCDYGERMCMVRRITLTQIKENSNSSSKIWLLQRNCTKHCEPGCIVIGERTKLHACTTCCEKDNCNIGSGSQSVALFVQPLVLIVFYQIFVVFRRILGYWE